jgi:hemerythrin
MSTPEKLPDNYTWNDQYLVEVRKLDEQHRALFMTSAKIYRLLLGHQDMDQIDKLFSDLIRQTIVHFHIEEQLMQVSSFPDYKRHKGLHDMLVEQLKDMQSSQQTLKSLHYIQPWVDKVEVADFLSGWLINHILDEDKKLGAFLRDAGVQ